MKKFLKDPALVGGILFLLTFGVIILRSVAPQIFPLYWIYLVIALVAFFVFAGIDFEILSFFSRFLYVGSLLFLGLPLLIGQVTRGAVRWIPLGALTIQPAEIVRPFLFVFWATYLNGFRFSFKEIFKLAFLVLLPLGLILAQPSLGVAVLTFIGFAGIFLAIGLDRKLIVGLFLVAILALPVSWFFLAPYQKDRVTSFLFPSQDPSGVGYNAIQSMIAVGSGKLTGRGLGEGVQTQLAFLPERHTDFIFASIAEEMGLVGALLLLVGILFVLSRITTAMEKPASPVARAFLAGIFLSLLAQTVEHIGMNMGLFPITGVPLPLVSAGGSSLVATMMALGMVVGSRKA